MLQSLHRRFLKTCSTQNFIIQQGFHTLEGWLSDDTQSYGAGFSLPLTYAAGCFSNYPDDPPTASSNSAMLPLSPKGAQEALKRAAFLTQFAGKYHSCVAFCSDALYYPPLLGCQAVNHICLVNSLASLIGEEQARQRKARRLSPSPCALPWTVFPIPWGALDAPWEMALEVCVEGTRCSEMWAICLPYFNYMPTPLIIEICHRLHRVRN